MSISVAGSAIPMRDLNRNASARLKMAALAAMPSERDNTEVSVKMGLRASNRSAYRRSAVMGALDWPPPGIVSARVSRATLGRMLIALSGLPGTGKTTIARELARMLGGVHVRIDSIEQSLRNDGLEV